MGTSTPKAVMIVFALGATWCAVAGAALSALMVWLPSRKRSAR
ncbi:hypothetical protein [Rothia mucilaginosa]|nr:hypothetical protein [Rothia mucilaginosa]